MPKDRRDRSLSSRASPYPCSSNCAIRSSSKNPLETVEDDKEWEEARCPVCMEHPHNAVLLLCSSHEKGCRAYMCDTSYRHSNCLDQFRKASGEPSATSTEEAPQASTGANMVTLEAPQASIGANMVTFEAPQTSIGANMVTFEAPQASTGANMVTFEAPQASTGADVVTSEAVHMDLQGERSEEEGMAAVPTLPCEDQVQPKLACPLCRGQVNGWIVVEPARRFMNDKSRSCACETCDFSGNYGDLRKHARLNHPLVRPSESDPQRERNWRMLERERDLGDVLSTIQSAFGDDRAEDSMVIPSNGGLLSVLIFFRVSRSSLSETGSSSSSSIWSSPSRSRGQTRSRRRTSVATLWGENYEAESGSTNTSRDGENVPSEGVPASWHVLEQNQRWPMSDDEES